MSTNDPSHLTTGRTNQKLRTRLVLLSAARDLMERGETVSVTAAAKASGISVATAYRYFSDPDTLASEAVLDLNLAKSGNLLAETAEALADIDEVEERVVIVHRILFDFTRRMEMPYRLYLAKTLEAHVKADRNVKAGGTPKATARGGRRIPMFEMALEPVKGQYSARALGDLVRALSAATGIEAFIVLKDICQLSDADIDRIAEGNIRAIVRAGLEEV